MLFIYFFFLQKLNFQKINYFQIMSRGLTLEYDSDTTHSNVYEYISNILTNFYNLKEKKRKQDMYTLVFSS